MQLARVAALRALVATGEARTIRLAARVSLHEAAQSLKTSPSTLSRAETGKCIPKADLALSWADLLDQLRQVVA